MSDFEQARREAEAVMAVPGVVAVGEGADPAGLPVIVVLADLTVDGVAESVPTEILGFGVRLEHSGPIQAEDSETTAGPEPGEQDASGLGSAAVD